MPLFHMNNSPDPIEHKRMAQQVEALQEMVESMLRAQALAEEDIGVESPTHQQYRFIYRTYLAASE